MHRIKIDSIAKESGSLKRQSRSASMKPLVEVSGNVVTIRERVKGKWITKKVPISWSLTEEEERAWRDSSRSVSEAMLKDDPDYPL